MDEKQFLRARLRKARREYVAALPTATRALLFMRLPAPIAAMVPEGALVGLYHATADEAPTRGYARWLFENGRQIALPWFAERDAAMQFRVWLDPFDDDTLEPGPFGSLQPKADADVIEPQVVFVPLLGFTANGERLGQGGGHYDRWLAANSSVKAIGMAWDCQFQDNLPCEPHDRRLDAMVTPTRFYEGTR